MGYVIEQISDDNANVVVGTVIDPEISDQICVTVVATGLGVRKRQKQLLIMITMRGYHVRPIAQQILRFLRFLELKLWAIRRLLKK